jgi:hypothetical protein
VTIVVYQDVLKYSFRKGVPIPELSALFKKEEEVIDWNDGFELTGVIHTCQFCM